MEKKLKPNSVTVKDIDNLLKVAEINQRKAIANSLSPVRKTGIIQDFRKL